MRKPCKPRLEHPPFHTGSKKLRIEDSFPPLGKVSFFGLEPETQQTRCGKGPGSASLTRCQRCAQPLRTPSPSDRGVKWYGPDVATENLQTVTKESASCYKRVVGTAMTGILTTMMATGMIIIAISGDRHGNECKSWLFASLQPLSSRNNMEKKTACMRSGDLGVYCIRGCRACAEFS